MTWGVIGVLLVALALGVGVGACWMLGTTILTRWTPALLAGAYYVAAIRWPHPAIEAMLQHRPYQDTEAVRVLLLGLALMVVMVELVVRLRAALRSNRQLRAALTRQESP